MTPTPESADQSLESHPFWKLALWGALGNIAQALAVGAFMGALSNAPSFDWELAGLCAGGWFVGCAIGSACSKRWLARRNRPAPDGSGSPPT